MLKLDDYVTIERASDFRGVSLNTLRNWHRDGKITVYLNPISGYKLFRKTDLADLLHQIEEVELHSTGWNLSARRSKNPR